MANGYDALHANVEARFLSLRNHHAAAGATFDALQQLALPPLAEPLSGEADIAAAGERLRAAFGGAEAACEEGHEQLLLPAFGAACAAAQASTAAAEAVGEAWQADAQMLLDDLQAFESADLEARGAAQQSHEDYAATLRELAGAFAESFERLHDGLSAFAEDVAGAWQP